MNYLMTRNRDIPSLFDDLFFKDFFGHDDFFASIPSLKKIDYPVDIYETDKGLAIDIAAVGLNKPDVKIEIKDDVLSVSHNRSNESIGYAYQGITKKSFNLAWRISDKFDVSKTEAQLDKGLLKISIPSAPEKQPKQIEVSIK